MFEKYNPLKIKYYFCVVEDSGFGFEAGPVGCAVLEAYNSCSSCPDNDLMAISYQRQGHMYTLSPHLGGEAIATGQWPDYAKRDRTG